MGVSLLKINRFGIWEMDGKGGWEDCQEDQSIILSLISPRRFWLCRGHVDHNAHQIKV